jgi:hypothetical protein
MENCDVVAEKLEVAGGSLSCGSIYLLYSAIL